MCLGGDHRLIDNGGERELQSSVVLLRAVNWTGKLVYGGSNANINGNLDRLLLLRLFSS